MQRNSIKIQNRWRLTALLSITLSCLPLQAATIPEGTSLSPVQEIVRNGGQEPTSIDPQLIQEDVGWIRAFDLFEGLYSQDPEGNLEPGVASSYAVNADNTVYTFNLRKDAKWSNGEPVTAEDFVYGFNARLILPPPLRAPGTCKFRHRQGYLFANHQ
ncbi:ABC transporter substrate-binding protein [Marinomonas mediterranea]|uniref:ABC transporter substrate-binding protein n=1 Tax=Marinomonas mediterranea TaxID=119864 RepID=UPI00234BF280|nr:ABC transporter substrate-binding protein [Marinomonas mediterranea]